MGSRVLRLRGLPFSCSNDEVLGFFEGYDPRDVYLGSKNGWAGRAGARAGAQLRGAARRPAPAPRPRLKSGAPAGALGPP